MRRPTLPLIATSAVVGAMAITVPALAAAGASPKAHSARARHCTAVIVISHHRRVRACLIPGPRGFTGFPGPRGATGKTGRTGKNGSNGKNGTNGTNGTNGAAGAPGTARAYAIVQPTSPTAANLVAASSIATVSEIKEGVYCVVPASPINAAAEPAAVSAEISYSPTKAPGLIALNMQRTNGCPAGQFEVDTYTPAGTTLSSGYAFTIVVP
jgi:hypothetical protein